MLKCKTCTKEKRAKDREDDDKQKAVYDILAEKLDKDHGKDWRRDRATVRTLQKAAKQMLKNEERNLVKG